MRSPTLPGLSLCLMLAACGGKKDNKQTPNNSNTPNNAGNTSSSAPVANAAGGAIPGIPTVTECPKSLAGPDEVNRIITKACGPVIVADSYQVNGSLTLEAGAQLKFKAGTELSVGYLKASKLIVKGTAQEPVLFTSADDAVPGSWLGVRLYNNADRSQIDGLVIENAGDAERGALWLDDVEEIAFKNSTIRNAKDLGLLAVNKSKFSEFSKNTFENTGKVPLAVEALTVGTLGPDNKFPADATIEVRGGYINSDAKWQWVGAPLRIVETVNVEGQSGAPTLTIEAGVEARFEGAKMLSIGYGGPGKLKVNGTKEKPVRFVGVEEGVAKWYGVYIYSNGEATIQNALFKDAGGQDDKGALSVEGGKASVSGATFKGNKLAASVEIEGDLVSLGGSTFDGNEKALRLYANHVKGLAADNTYTQPQPIEIRGGVVTKEATWNVQAGANVQATENIAVEGNATLTVSAGFEIAFDDAKELSVGYGSQGTLKLMGTAEKPIKLKGIREEKGSWNGVSLYSNAVGSTFESVEIFNAAGDAGIRIDNNSNTKLTKVSCSGCEATLQYTCNSKVELIEITAGKETPKDVLKPEGCQ